MPQSPAFNFTATGLSKETTFGVNVLPTLWVSARDITPTETNNWLTRDSARAQVGREEPDTGTYGGALTFTAEADPDVIVPVLAYAMGTESVMPNATSGNPVANVTTTLSAAAAAGSTTISVTSATGIAAGTPLVLDPLFTQSESAIVASIAGTTVTLTAATKYAHAANAAVQALQAFDHTLTFGIPRPSLSVQFNRKTDVVSYVGNKIRTFSLTLSPAQLLSVQFTTIFQNALTTIAGTPAFSRIHPFRVIDPGNSLLVNGALSPCSMLSATINVDNGLGQPEFVLANGRLITNIPEIQSRVSGSFQLQFTNNYFQQLFWGNAGATTSQSIVQATSLAFTILSPMAINGVVRYGLQVILANCRIASAPTAGRTGSLLTQTISFEAFQSLPNANDDIKFIGTTAASLAA